ncbi:hypothetical protein [Pseudonocardia sp. ICBG1293]|uniref:hypothetical protein n=1 Tax=Pseudonocardia sp. ICBG1293 TaxID=2844382 RepID=UPI001CCE6A57|nr:hypothetical protein [Pseudonocardia sp. ICBG1293]
MLIDGTGDAVADHAGALRALVDRLDDTAGLLAGIRAAVADAWDDPAGEAVAARLDLVGREVHRLADEAARDAARAEDAVPAGPVATHRDTAECPGSARPGGTGPGGDDPVRPDGTGMRLPGLTGTRVGDRRGPLAPAPVDPPVR